MTDERDYKVVFHGMSRVNCDTTSIVGTVMYNGLSVNHGFTPRRSFNTASVTTAQLAEVVATILQDVFGETPTYKT